MFDHTSIVSVCLNICSGQWLFQFGGLSCLPSSNLLQSRTRFRWRTDATIQREFNSRSRGIAQCMCHGVGSAYVCCALPRMSLFVESIDHYSCLVFPHDLHRVLFPCEWWVAMACSACDNMKLGQVQWFGECIWKSGFPKNMPPSSSPRKKEAKSGRESLWASYDTQAGAKQSNRCRNYDFSTAEVEMKHLSTFKHWDQEMLFSETWTESIENLWL